MLIYPEVQKAIDALAGQPNTETIRTDKTSLTFNTKEGSYVSVAYNHDSLHQYQRVSAPLTLDVDGSKMRLHSIVPGTIELDGKNADRFLMYLASVKPDIIATGDVFGSLGSEALSKIKNLVNGATTKTLVSELPNLTFAKTPDGSYYADLILQKFKQIFSHPSREHFKHVFYVRGVRKWGIFIDIEGAKYTLFC